MRWRKRGDTREGGGAMSVILLHKSDMRNEDQGICKLSDSSSVGKAKNSELNIKSSWPRR